MTHGRGQDERLHCPLHGNKPNTLAREGLTEHDNLLIYDSKLKS